MRTWSLVAGNVTFLVATFQATTRTPWAAQAFQAPIPSSRSYSSRTRQSPSRFFVHHEVAARVAREASTSFMSDAASSSWLELVTNQAPAFWSASIMICLVGLLYTWEESVKSARERMPKTLMPVVDSMLGEMGGLGFIGLFLTVFVTDGVLGDAIGSLSERFLGDKETLLETFEFLHLSFFEVGITFFAVAGLTVLRVLNKIGAVTEATRVILDTVKRDENACLAVLADALEVESVSVDMNQDGQYSDSEVTKAVRATPKISFMDELRLDDKKIRAETLLVRERMLSNNQATLSFRVENYYEQIFGRNLEEMVELSPLTWLPLIIPISLGRSIDMAHDLVSASSPGAFLSSGEFLGSPNYFSCNVALGVINIVWGLWNFWKMAEMKEMLLPTLVHDCAAGPENTVCLLPPRYEDPKLRAKFNSSPSFFGAIESIFGTPARNIHEEVFGKAGHSGRELYSASIKLQTWFVVSAIVLWGSQIVARDAEALRQGAVAGIPSLVIPELAIFGTLVALAIAQLWTLVPQTFLNYCLVTSIELMTDEEAVLAASARSEDDEPVRSPPMTISLNSTVVR